ncbi:hypothetical protein ABZ069_37545 [Streptomyces microflavus]|uniref:hypothetical protein n=1 Tax=Streptomyces microflavus TaxID=1919 RepID=UPI0033AA667F
MEMRPTEDTAAAVYEILLDSCEVIAEAAMETYPGDDHLAEQFATEVAMRLYGADWYPADNPTDWFEYLSRYSLWGGFSKALSLQLYAFSRECIGEHLPGYFTEISIVISTEIENSARVRYPKQKPPSPPAASTMRYPKQKPPSPPAASTMRYPKQKPPSPPDVSDYLDVSDEGKGPLSNGKSSDNIASHRMRKIIERNQKPQHGDSQAESPKETSSRTESSQRPSRGRPKKTRAARSSMEPYASSSEINSGSSESTEAAADGMRRVPSRWSWLRLAGQSDWHGAVLKARTQLHWDHCDAEWLKLALQRMTNSSGEPIQADAVYNWLLEGGDDFRYMEIIRNVSEIQLRNIQYSVFGHLLNSTSEKIDVENQAIVRLLEKGVEVPIQLIYPLGSEVMRDIRDAQISVSDHLGSDFSLVVGGDSGGFINQYAEPLKRMSKAGVARSATGSMKIRFDGKISDRVIRNRFKKGKIVVFGFNPAEFEQVKIGLGRISGKRVVHHSASEVLEGVEREQQGAAVTPANRCELSLNVGLPKFMSFDSPADAERELVGWGIFDGNTILPGIALQQFVDERLAGMTPKEKKTGFHPATEQRGQLMIDLQVGGELRAPDYCATISLTAVPGAIRAGVQAVGSLDSLRPGGSCRYVQYGDYLYLYSAGAFGDLGVFKLICAAAGAQISAKDPSGVISRTGIGKKVTVNAAAGSDPAQLVAALRGAGWSVSFASDRNDFYRSAGFSARG